MIRVHRGDPPEGFSEREVERLQHFRDLLERGRTPTDAWKELRPKLQGDFAVLVARSHAKCAWCESKMEHVERVQLEHFRPKGLPEHRDRAFDWTNWLASCGRCNEAKGVRFPTSNGEPLLVDPASEDPAAHVAFVEAHVLGLGARGRQTIETLALDRPPLDEDRARWLGLVHALVLLALDEPTRAAARRLLLWCIQDEAPHAAMTRAWLAARAPRLARPVTPHPHVDLADARAEIHALLEEHSDRIRELT